MKKFLLFLIFFSAPVLANQKSGISPDGICETFVLLPGQNLPENYREIFSCEAVKNPENFSSMEETNVRRWFRSRQSLHELKKIIEFENENSLDPNLAKFRRPARGILTRSPRIRNRRLPTKENKENENLTEKNFVAPNFKRNYSYERAQILSGKGGFDDQNDIDRKNFYREKLGERPAILSNNYGAKRTGKLQNNPNWLEEIRSHALQKNYGRNPFRLRPNVKKSPTIREISNKYQRRFQRVEIGDLGGN